MEMDAPRSAGIDFERAPLHSSILLCWCAVSAIAVLHTAVPWLSDRSRYGKLYAGGSAPETKPWLAPLVWTLPNAASFRVMYVVGAAWCAWLLAETMVGRAHGARRAGLALANPYAAANAALSADRRAVVRGVPGTRGGRR